MIIFIWDYNEKISWRRNVLRWRCVHVMTFNMWREKDDHNDTSAILKCFEFTSTWENISHQNRWILTGIVIAYSESEKFI